MRRIMIPARHASALIWLLLLLTCLVSAQEMQPRAYLPAPVGLSFAGISYARNGGSLLFDPSLPVEDSRVSAHVPTFSLGGSFGVLGRSSQVLVAMPYVVADLTGRFAGTEQYRYRSGL